VSVKLILASTYNSTPLKLIGLYAHGEKKGTMKMDKPNPLNKTRDPSRL
jgi:hypothetical protein